MGKRTVAIYARVSTEHEAQLSALDNQVQYYDNILNNHPEWVLYDKYVDEGITGTSVNKRKNFLRMIGDAKDGKFDLIITREVSRFARNTVDTLQETRKLKKIGVEVWFTEDNIWTLNDEDGELRLTIMATLAQNESKKISQRVKAGQKISFQNAVPYGTGNILGYDRVGDEMIVNEEQAETVKLIFKMYIQGTGTRGIAYELEKRGMKTSSGLSRWHCTTVARILDNPFYCGVIVYRKEFIPDYLEQKKQKNKGDVDQVVVEGKHTPIISKEDFQKAQEIKKSKCLTDRDNSKRGLKKSENVWANKLVCSCGGHFFRATWYKSKKTGRLNYGYKCMNACNYGSAKSREKRGLSQENACDVKMFAEWKLNVMAGILFRYIWTDKKRVITIANDVLEKSVNESILTEDVSSELNDYERRLSLIRRKRNNLLDMRLADELEPDVYREKIRELDKEQEDINNNIDKIKKSISTPDTDNSLEKRVEMLKFTLDQNFEINTYDIPDEIIDAFIRKVVVYKDKFEFYLNLFDDEDSSYTCKIEKYNKSKNSEDKISNNPSVVCSGTGSCKLIKLYNRYYYIISL